MHLLVEILGCKLVDMVRVGNNGSLNALPLAFAEFKVKGVSSLF